MTASKILGLAIGTAIAALAASGAAMAHDPSGKGGPPADQLKRVMMGMKGLLDMDGSDAAKGIYARSIQWPPQYQKLRACFMGGNDATNQAVADIAKLWTDDPGMGLKLDFGKKGKPRQCDPNGREAQIRISYDKPGYWSFVGQVSTVYIAQQDPSVNLQDIDKADPAKLAQPGFVRGMIIHEFGHALGLLHEHQSPISNCANEFNWDYLTKYLGGEPNNWDEETIKFNMATLGDEDLMMTDFDKDSVMLYSFPPEYYLKGDQSSCYIPRDNDQISALDRTTINYMYPSDPAEREKNFEQSKAQMAEIVKKASSDGTKAVSQDYVTDFFGSKGVAADEE